MFEALIMSFVLNSCQQMSLFDSLGFLSARKLERINHSWARWFSDHIFTQIDETIFAPLYSSTNEFQTKCSDQCTGWCNDSERA